MLELNYYEKENGVISLYNLMQIYDVRMVLCNNIVRVDEELEWDNYDLVYDEEEDRFVEIFQYFLTYERDKELFERLGYPTAWSNVLEVWVVGITHFGTGWDYVLTDVPIEDYKNWFSNL